MSERIIMQVIIQLNKTVCQQLAFGALAVTVFSEIGYIPAGPTARRRGLNEVDVRTDEVSEESAEDIRGELPWPGGSRPNVEKRDGGAPGLGPGLVMSG